MHSRFGTSDFLLPNFWIGLVFVAAACGPQQAYVSGVDAGTPDDAMVLSQDGAVAADHDNTAGVDAAVTCSNVCSGVGGTQCSGNSVQTCDDLDNDGCLEWSAGQACPSGDQCVAGACVCQNACSSAGATRCDGAGIQTCGDFNSDGCLAWSAAQACPDGQSCSADQCSSNCTDDCSVGEQQCSGNGVKSCGNYDSDSCLDWSSVNDCQDYEACEGGQCVATCGNDCSVSGVSVCVGNATRSCGQFDPDTCLEWSPLTDCKASETCTNGVCVAHCSSNCEVDGALRCDGNGVQTCSYDDGCWIWSAPVDCGAQVCADGECTAVCSNECQSVGEHTCDGANAYRVCGDFDDDDCLEWGSDTACGVDEICDAGYCATVVCDNDEFEPNNGRETARYLWAGSYANLQVCADDQDWFYTYVFAGETLQVDLNFVHAEGDIDMVLLDAAGSAMAYGASIDDNESIERLITESGFYYIKVYGWAGAQNSYGLALGIVEPETCVDDLREDNDSIETALRINAGTHYGLKVCSGDDDFYKIGLQLGDMMTVRISFRNENGDLDLYVMDRAGQTLEVSNTVTDNEEVSLSRRDVGDDYIIQVHGFAGAHSPYTLQVDVVNLP